MALALFTACNKTPQYREVATPSFAKGADISWVTEMEAQGCKFYKSGKAMECTALMKELGCNAVRYRVWVKPSGGWCNKEDVLLKAKRASELGLAIMIDFHYSDTWADPGNQKVPSGWPTTAEGLANKVSEHTTQVLTLLKDSGICVNWVQVGNETNTGMLWPTCKVNTGDAANFARVANAGYDAVKAVYPNAQVIIHHSNAQDQNGNVWFYNQIVSAGTKFDMIGLSLYPSYKNSAGEYPDWRPYCQAAVPTFKKLNETFSKPVMLVEFGMPAVDPDKAKEAAQYVLDGVKGLSWFKGIFYWEPESEESINGYAYGAFANGKSTGVVNLLWK